MGSLGVAEATRPKGDDQEKGVSMKADTGPLRRARLRVRVYGAVQGVGFRPFVYRLAQELGLTGYVQNSASGVTLEVEGPLDRLEAFRERLITEAPPNAVIHRVECESCAVRGDSRFVIRASDAEGGQTAFVLPDVATCSDCLREIFDPSDRRYRYPFTNCTNCGPRFTILEALPYDRSNTTMKAFSMCAACREEYEDPRNRRFHAQPNACPACGPHVELWGPDGVPLAREDEALRQTVEALRSGQIVAVKGLGGFHLWVDARDGRAVSELRRRKRRGEKPFALLYPSLAVLEAHAYLSPLEADLLQSPEAPIVLLRRTSRGEREIASEQIAPYTPYLGAMLPYTPLHHLLLHDLGTPVVATSGNLAEEPLCIDEREAQERLAGIADLFLVHNRPIARPCDDSVVRVIGGRPVLLRRARGYAPLPLTLPEAWPLPPVLKGSGALLAVGGHLKNTVALAIGRHVFLSQHVGDLDTALTRRAFLQAIRDLTALYRREPSGVICDAHPDYASTQHARRLGKPLQRVQHHVAHVWGCVAEHDVELPALGVAWDGTGYGPDGTVWGGEFFVLTPPGRAERVAHLRRFPLPGGEQAVREPRRAALGLLYALWGDRAFARRDIPTLRAFSPPELEVLRGMLRKRVRCPETSSAGRLFDAVASLAGVRQRTSFEGQAAVELEHRAEQVSALAPDLPEENLPRWGFALLRRGGMWTVDWEPFVIALLGDPERPSGERRPRAEEIAWAFHRACVEAIVTLSRQIGLPRVVLSGGCFQNRLLTEWSLRRLKEEGIDAFVPERVPPGDGGLALGQVAAAIWQLTQLPSRRGGGEDVPSRPRTDR